MEERLKEIKEWFEDLIDDETAELLARYSTGERVEFKISDAKNKPGKVVFRGVVERVESKVAKNGKTFFRVLVKDDTDYAYVYLWDEAAEVVSSGDLSEGDEVRFSAINKNGFFTVNSGEDVEIVKKRSDEFEGYVISTGEFTAIFSGRLIRLRGTIDAKRGSYVRVKVSEGRISSWEVVKEDVFEPIERVIPGRFVNVRGFVIGIGEKEDRWAEITISDKKDRIDIVLWDRWTKIYDEADVGDVVEIYNAYAKTDGFTKLHCGYNSYVVLEKIY